MHENLTDGSQLILARTFWTLQAAIQNAHMSFPYAGSDDEQRTHNRNLAALQREAAVLFADLLPRWLNGEWTLTKSDLIWGWGGEAGDVIDHPVTYRLVGSKGQVTPKNAIAISQPYFGSDNELCVNGELPSLGTCWDWSRKSDFRFHCEVLHGHSFYCPSRTLCLLIADPWHFKAPPKPEPLAEVLRGLLRRWTRTCNERSQRSRRSRQRCSSWKGDFTWGYHQQHQERKKPMDGPEISAATVAALDKAATEMSDEEAYELTSVISTDLMGGGFEPESIRLYVEADPLEETEYGNEFDRQYGVGAVLCIELDSPHHILTFEKVDGSRVDVDTGDLAAIHLTVFGIAQNRNLVEALIHLGERLKPLAAARRRCDRKRLR